MFDRIFHPSDFTEASEVAFCHALKIALAAGTKLRMLHVDGASEHSHHHDFPRVRDLLEQWKVLEPGSGRSKVSALGIEVSKAILQNDNPVTAISKFLAKHPASLVVLAAHEDSKWMSHSRAETIARKAAVTTLMIPDGTTGFVSPETGKLQLRNILIPVAMEPPAAPTIRSIQQLVAALTIKTVRVHFLHVGNQSSLPELPHHLSDEIEITVHMVEGDTVTTIAETSREVRADLVAMTTKGHHGFLDALRGDTTEQVFRNIRCPLWAVTAK